MAELVRAVAEGREAFARMTPNQRAVLKRQRRIGSVRGYVLLDDGTVQIGYETPTTGRDREMIVASTGEVLRRYNTYEYGEA